MNELLIVNPRRRKKKANKARKRRRTAVAVAAPKKRRRRRAAPKSFGSVRRYRRNPRFGGVIGKVQSAIVPAAIAAGGALAADVALGYVPVPDKFKQGALRHVTRALAAVGVGLAAGFVVKPETARAVMGGGLTVAFHGALRDLLAKAAPSVRLADLDEDMGALEDELNALIDNEQGVGALVDSGGMSGFDPAFAGMDTDQVEY